MDEQRRAQTEITRGLLAGLASLILLLTAIQQSDLSSLLLRNICIPARSRSCHFPSGPNDDMLNAPILQPGPCLSLHSYSRVESLRSGRRIQLSRPL